MNVFTHYYQFGVWDKENRDSYPISNGEKSFVTGDFGLVVLMNAERDISVKVYQKKSDLPPFQLFNSIMTVGSEGVEFGNIPAATVGKFDIKKGKYRVLLCGDAQTPNSSSSFGFYFEPIR